MSILGVKGGDYYASSSYEQAPKPKEFSEGRSCKFSEFCYRTERRIPALKLDGFIRFLKRPVHMGRSFS